MVRLFYLLSTALCFPAIFCLPVHCQNYGQYSHGTQSAFASTGAGGFDNGFSGLSPQSRQTSRNNRTAAMAQGRSTMSSLEQTLDAVDKPSSWAVTPMSGSPPGLTQSRGGRRNSLQPPRTAGPGAGASAMSAMFPSVSRQEMMRVFLEGGSPQTGSSSFAGAPQSNGSAVSTAYSNYQIASSEETKSRNYANTARCNSSQWNRKDAASQAEYAANNANYAAQRAESAAYSGDPKAQSYANLARQCANRARANANRARYNADTIR